MRLRLFVAGWLLALLLGGAILPAQAHTDPAVNLTMGNPSSASTGSETNYLIQRPQYALSYHRYNGIPNWASWHLDAGDLGSTPRGDFQPDSSLPSGWYRVQPGDYSGSGYDRGHMTPSGDRTLTRSDNDATFLMTNILPQAPDNNQGPWAALEDYSRSLAQSGSELYIISGGDDSLGTIAGGKVRVPAFTWKVIMVLPEGSNDVARVTSSTRLIGVSMPNKQGIRSNSWKQYRYSIDQIESWTGYDFFANVPDAIESVIEARVDTQ